MREPQSWLFLILDKQNEERQGMKTALSAKFNNGEAPGEAKHGKKRAQIQ